VFDHLETGSDFVAEKTLRSSVSLSGVGLHTGAPVQITTHPAAAGNGILFRRQDLLSTDGAARQSAELSKVTINAHPKAVSRTALGTTLTNEHGVSVNTVEHLMAAFAGLEIDNALVEISGPELPIMDGSAEPFITILDQAGLRSLPARRLALRIKQRVAVKDGDHWIYLTPNSDASDYACHMDVMVDFEDAAIGRQHAVFDMGAQHFRQTIAAARTFCNKSDVDLMHERGLALGGSYDNAIVVDNGKVLNKGGLRFDGEFVLHKALDLIGDLYLLGRPIIGLVTAFKPGHDLNNRLTKALLEAPDSYELVEIPVVQTPAMRAEA
jgi:UDP-3-O-[3-hydroxymyristoyl] N-acetylglucosamine deacetylase